MGIRPRLIDVWLRLSAQRLDELGQLLGGTCPALGLAGVLGCLLARLSVTLDKGLKGDGGHKMWLWAKPVVLEACHESGDVRRSRAIAGIEDRVPLDIVTAVGVVDTPVLCASTISTQVHVLDINSGGESNFEVGVFKGANLDGCSGLHV